MIKLKSIDEEAADCRKAFVNSKIGDLVQHCHHEIGCEVLIEEAEARIAYILSYKPVPEQALRLRLFRPIAMEDLPAEYQKAYVELQKAGEEWRKADAAHLKAYAELQKADAAWRKAYAECRKARAECEKARAEYWKAYVALQKARVECEKAEAEWLAAYNASHSVLCKEPDCPWNGKTIFA